MERQELKALGVKEEDFNRWVALVKEMLEEEDSNIVE